MEAFITQLIAQHTNDDEYYTHDNPVDYPEVLKPYLKDLIMSMLSFYDCKLKNPDNVLGVLWDIILTEDIPLLRDVDRTNNSCHYRFACILNKNKIPSKIYIADYFPDFWKVEYITDEIENIDVDILDKILEACNYRKIEDKLYQHNYLDIIIKFNNSSFCIDLPHIY